MPPAPVVPPWDRFPLNKETRVTLSLHNASIDAVIHLFTEASGVPIIKGPDISASITLESTKPLSLDDAFALVDADLRLQNIEFAKGGKWLVVEAIPAPAPPAPKPSSAPSGPSHPVAGAPGAPGAPGMPGMPGMPGGPGAPGASPATAEAEPENVLVTYKIKYADATELARLINEAFTALPTPPQNPFQPQQPPGPLTPKQPAVRASAEDYSNTLLVNAPDKQQKQIAQVIAAVDVNTDTPHKSRVFNLVYARADDVEPVVEEILDAMTPLGRGGSTSSENSRRNNNPFVFFFGGQQNQNSNGTVVSSVRTNSIVVTATDEALSQIADVIADLDKPAVYQSTTFVHKMKNARADVVANLLNQSFGNRQANGPIGGSLTGSSPYQTLASQNNGNNSNNLGGISQQPGFNNNGPNNQQNNGNNGINNGSQNGENNNGNLMQNLASETSSLDDQGHVVNVRNLMGAVLLVPNIDTNSIICVCEPEDRKTLEDILTQMDEIPKQVMIETLVVEATLDKTDSLGIEYSLGPNVVSNSTGQSGPTLSQMFGSIAPVTAGTLSGLTYVLNAGQFQAVAQALRTSTRFNVLSTPRIFTTNNATAQINISQSVPYISTSTPVVEGTSTTLENSYSFLNIGIILTVTPRISDDGYVTMDLTQTANDLQGYQSFGIGSPEAPIVNQREAETTVSVKDGQTVVLGGIIENSMTDTMNKVPILGDIPLLGSLFRSDNKVKDKTELLVFMTPHVVSTPEDAERLKEQTENEVGDVQKMLPKSVTGSRNPTTGSTPDTPATDVPPTVTLPANAPPPNPAPIVTVTVPGQAADPAAGTTAPAIPAPQ